MSLSPPAIDDPNANSSMSISRVDVALSPPLAGPSRLEQLPRELRERIYWYLGVPVAGLCLHVCSNSCLFPFSTGLMLLLATIRRLSGPISEQIHEVRKECNTKVGNYMEKRGEERILKVERVEVRGAGELKKVICERKRRTTRHRFDHLPNDGLLGTSRFFYHDIAACLHHPTTLYPVSGCANKSETVIQKPGDSGA